MNGRNNFEFSARTRQSALDQLVAEPLDILVVGGGITGAGIARDAAMRGYRVGLLDRGDFASGTSSKSSKLVHAGVRYLEMFEFGLVFEASRERRTLMHIAPQMVSPLPFLFPVYKDARWKPWMIDVGMWLYDALAMFRNVKRHRMYSPTQIKQMMRGIDVRNISGGAYYYDGQVDDARLTLEAIRGAFQHGARIANYAQVDGLIKQKDRIIGVEAHDVRSGRKFSIHSHIVVNATGPWTDSLLQMDDAHAVRHMRPTKGIHLLLPRPKIGGDNAVAFPAHSDGRLMFLIPWGDFTIIGTTDTDFEGDYDRVFADSSDVDYVIAAANHAFPESPIQKSDVVSAYAGLRPLVLQLGKSATRTSREHMIWTTASGLITIAGGKLTTFRSMAEELVDLVGKRLLTEFNVAAQSPCKTALQSVIEGQEALSTDGQLQRVPEANGYPDKVIAHLMHTHGPEYPRVLEMARRDALLSQPIVEGLPYIWAEVPYAIEHEMALTPTDVLERRLHILNEARDNGRGAAAQVSAFLGEFLDWDKAKVDKEIKSFEEHAALACAFR